MMLENLPQVQALAPAEKWQLIDELWHDLARQVEGTSADQNIVNLLEHRFANYLADPASGCAEQEVFERLAERKREWK